MFFVRYQDMGVFFVPVSDPLSGIESELSVDRSASMSVVRCRDTAVFIMSVSDPYQAWNEDSRERTVRRD